MSRIGDKFRSVLRVAEDLSPGCRQATRLQSEAMDHPLPMRQRIGLRIHLFLCKWCRRYGEQIHFLRMAAKHCDEGGTGKPGGLSPEARERIRRKLDEAK